MSRCGENGAVGRAVCRVPGPARPPSSDFASGGVGVIPVVQRQVLRVPPPLCHKNSTRTTLEKSPRARNACVPGTSLKGFERSRFPRRSARASHLGGARRPSRNCRTHDGRVCAPARVQHQARALLPHEPGGRDHNRTDSLFAAQCAAATCCLETAASTQAVCVVQQHSGP